MKLSSIPLFFAVLAAVAANAIEPVALFKRQAPDRRRQGRVPPPQDHQYRLPLPRAQGWSSDPSHYQVFNDLPPAYHRFNNPPPAYHFPPPYQVSAPQPASRHQSFPQVAHHPPAQQQHNQGQLHRQALHSVDQQGQRQAHHLQAHQNQHRHSREAPLHGSPVQRTDETHLPFQRVRHHHVGHAAVATANGEAAHSNRLAAANARLAESLEIPTDWYSNWDHIARFHTARARDRQGKKVDHEERAKRRRDWMTDEEIETAKAQAHESKIEADKSSDKTWQIIRAHRPSLSREDNEPEALNTYMRTHSML